MDALAPPPRPKRRPPLPVGLPDDALDSVLGLALALARPPDPFALPLDLGDIELPPASGGSADEAARLRASAPLYLAAELESTRLVPAVEVLAGLFVSAALPGDPGPAAERLRDFRRAARDRLTAAERDALFGRLFGKPYGPVLAADGEGRNGAFEGLMIDLCEALSDFEQGSRSARDDVRLHTVCEALAGNLALRTGGVTEYAARDCLEQLRDALEILKVPHVQRMFGARSVWLTVREVARRYLGEETDIVSRVARGRAGTLVLAWLADVLPRVGDVGRPLLDPGSAVPGAAVGWMQATLSLHETSASAAAQAGRRLAA
jgi:hypothetical protein